MSDAFEETSTGNNPDVAFNGNPGITIVVEDDVCEMILPENENDELIASNTCGVNDITPQPSTM